MGTSFVDLDVPVTSDRARLLREAAKQLIQLADEIDAEGRQAVGHPEAGLILDEFSHKRECDFSAAASTVYKRRRLRERFFPSAFFGEAAWDILLDLYAKNEAGVTVSVSSSCIASAVPATTALRWLRLLEETGYVERSQHERDSRVTLIRLTKFGQKKLNDYFALLG